MYHNICDYIDKEQMEIDRKIASGGKLSMQEVELGDKLAHWEKSLYTAEAMKHPEEYGYNDNYSRNYGNYNDNSMNHEYGARGRGSNARRDSMGRYATGSRMYRDDDMMGELHELMEKAPNEQVRRKYNEFINEIQNMM